MESTLSQRLPSFDAGAPPAWKERLERDRRLAQIRQPEHLRRITDELLERSRGIGARSFALTGSTALEARTPVSDLDFYIVGSRPEPPDSGEEELDIHVVDIDEFAWRLLAGDDYAHWTVRYGLVLHDQGPLWWAAESIRKQRLWPDPTLKANQAQRALRLTLSVLETGDHEAAVEQARVCFSLAARWALLAKGEFPMARRHLATQLEGGPLDWLGAMLAQTMFSDPSDSDLLRTARDLVPLVEAAVNGQEASPLGEPRTPIGRIKGTRSAESRSVAELSAVLFGTELSMNEVLERLGAAEPQERR